VLFRSLNSIARSLNSGSSERSEPYSFVAVNAAGCGSAMKEYGSLLSDDPEFKDRAIEFSSRVRDISELLVDLGIKPPPAIRKIRVAYDAPCHLIHAQKISRAPVELMGAIPGVELVPLRGAENCCGGAGVYNLQHQELSLDILSNKIESVRASGAEAVASANPGCIMQIGAGLMLAGEKLGVEKIDVVHPVQLLDAAYGTEEVEKWQESMIAPLIKTILPRWSRWSRWH